MIDKLKINGTKTISIKDITPRRIMTAEEVLLEELKSVKSRLEELCDKIEPHLSPIPYINTDEYNKGQWDMFERITNAYFGKQYYFPQDDGTIYSRHSDTYITKEEAVKQFLDELYDFKEN